MEEDPGGAVQRAVGGVIGQKVLRLHAALDTAEIPHAFGGALALAYYAQPRATTDIDIDIFLPEAEADRLVKVVAPIGVTGTPEQLQALRRDGQARFRWDQIPVDFFLMNIPLLESAASRVVHRDFTGTTIPVLAVEDLLICKASFNRKKDWLDIEEAIAITTSIDRSYLMGWLTEMLGESDPRVLEMQSLLNQRSA